MTDYSITQRLRLLLGECPASQKDAGLFFEQTFNAILINQKFKRY
jgi:hypothetical protein